MRNQKGGIVFSEVGFFATPPTRSSKDQSLFTRKHNNWNGITYITHFFPLTAILAQNFSLYTFSRLFFLFPNFHNFLLPIKRHRQEGWFPYCFIIARGNFSSVFFCWKDKFTNNNGHSRIKKTASGFRFHTIINPWSCGSREWFHINHFASRKSVSCLTSVRVQALIDKGLSLSRWSSYIPERCATASHWLMKPIISTRLIPSGTDFLKPAAAIGRFTSPRKTGSA